MPKKLISASLHIIAILLLCSIALTGCLGTASAFPGQSDMNGEYLTPDTPQDFISENTQSQTTTTAHEHTFSDATCTLPKTCSICGVTEGEPHGHNWNKATCIAPATCTEAATCIVCGKTKGSTTSHNYSKGKCKDCGDIDTSYDSSSSSMVWIPTNGGKKYHSHSGCSNMKNPKKYLFPKPKA